MNPIVIRLTHTCQVENINCTHVGVSDGSPIPNSANPKNLNPLEAIPTTLPKTPPSIPPVSTSEVVNPELFIVDIAVEL